MDWELAKALIDMHKRYSINQTNHYIQLFDLLEEEAPAIEQDIDQARFDYDDSEYQGAGHEPEARAKAIEMITNWIDQLQELKERLQG